MASASKTKPPDRTVGSAADPLARKDKLAQLLLDAAPDAMVIVNQQGKIILVNRQAEQMFGYSRNELLDHAVEVIMPERFRKRHVEHLIKYVAEPRSRAMGTELDLYRRDRDGTEFPVEIMLRPIRVGRQLLDSSANASRALRDTKPAILKIWAEPYRNDECVCVGVADNGPGMPPEIKERVLSSTYTSGAQDAGAGLGLLLVKSIVIGVKGSIDIESEPDQGTTVTLVLPAKHN